ncbi:MAG TPA: BON domain-containing protein [Candidatus Acidoferrales bacterium]|nr:BON domain-containing protein [Candidatus Acidoferrales bacterium]
MNNIAKRFGLLFGAGTLALILGMSAAPQAMAAANNPSAQQAPAPRGSAQYEAWLTNQVRHQLVMLPWLSVFDNLEYRVDGTTVILEGQVARASIKPDAETAVKHIEGVTNVENNIEVLPLSPMDNQIRLATYRAIYSEPGLQIYGRGTQPSIHIIVKNGNVTLVGVVDNQTDKNLAGIRANGVPNVFSVTNNLAVEKG